MRNFLPGTRREFSTTWWWCHTRDPELPMGPRLLVRSCTLPSCKFVANRLNIKRHYAQLQQQAFDVHCIALSREHTKNVKLQLGMLNELRIYEIFGILTFDIHVKFALEQMWSLKCLRTRRDAFVLCRRLTPVAAPVDCRICCYYWAALCAWDDGIC